MLDIKLSEPESMGAALRREASGHAPLMSDDTPLPELHEQDNCGSGVYLLCSLLLGALGMLVSVTRCCVNVGIRP